MHPQTSSLKKSDFHTLLAHLPSQGYTHFTRHFTKPNTYFKLTTVAIAQEPIENPPKSYLLQYPVMMHYPVMDSSARGCTLDSWHGTLGVFTHTGEEELDHEDKAMTSILVMSRNSPISWASRKQDVTVL